MISQIAREIVVTIGMAMTAPVEPTTSALPSSKLASDQNREEAGREDAMAAASALTGRKTPSSWR
jgi:hypothetical protein